jgi:hypothetical protein
MPVRVDAIVLRPNKRYLTRYTLDTATTQGGEIPLTVSLSPAMLAELEAELYAQTAMTVADIEEWTRCVDEAQPE